MKKKSILAVALAGVLAFGLIGCGGSTGTGSSDPKVIKIGVSP